MQKIEKRHYYRLGFVVSGIFSALLFCFLVSEADAQILPQTGWQLHYVDSEEVVAPVSGAAVNAFDGDAGTKWHTEWYLTDPDPGMPHELQIDLMAMYELYGFRYLPRQDGLSNGNVGGYEFYVSLDGIDWGTPVATGVFDAGAAEQEVQFPLTAGRYVRLKVLSEIYGNPYVSVAELNLLGGNFCELIVPSVRILSPAAGHIQSSSDLTVSTQVCFDPLIHADWGLKITLNGSDSIAIQSPPYETTFIDVAPGEHTLEAVLVDQDGNEVVTDATAQQVSPVGIGTYLIAVGDSITAGYGDDYPEDDVSLDGRNSGGGFIPVLNNAMTAHYGFPHFIANEGIPGARASDGLQAISAILLRHPMATGCMVMFGTNDANPTFFPVPSGRGLDPSDSGYPGTFKQNMQDIVDQINAAGMEVILAKNPLTLGDTNYSEPYPDPDLGERSVRIKDYNAVIDELKDDPGNGITVLPPDFYNFFYENNRYEFQYSDNLHPNGLGYQSMAEVWLEAFLLTGGMDE